MSTASLTDVAFAEDVVLKALAKVDDPLLHQDVVSLRYVQDVIVDVQGQTVKATLRLPTLAHPAAQDMARSCEASAREALQRTSTSEPGWSVSISLAARRPYGRTPSARNPGLANVEHAIAVSSCKGGVGKSTVAVNLAYALAAQGARVGLFDADIYGPSLPTMVSPADVTLRTSEISAKRSAGAAASPSASNAESSRASSPFGGSSPVGSSGSGGGSGTGSSSGSGSGGGGMVAKTPASTPSQAHAPPPLLAPIEHKGVKCLSFGWVSAASGVPGAGGRGAAVLRGPMVSKVVNQLLLGTDWGELDVLLVDMPPGTGDIQITICQALQLAGAVIVTTPQLLSYVDVAKGLEMFSGLGVPTLSVVENMAFFDCEHGTRHRPFGKGHLNRLKQDFPVPSAFELPLSAAICRGGDEGEPVVVAEPGAAESKVYSALARAVVGELLTRAHAAEVAPTVRFVEGRGIVLRYVSEAEAAEFVVDPAALRRRDGRGKVLPAAELPAGLSAAVVKPLGLVVKGNYGVAIDWADGRRGDIYTYDVLRRVAEEAGSGS